MPRATALLRDGSAAVVEEAAATLAPSAAQLPADLLWDLLTDPQRPAVRRAGHRLLTRRDRLTALRAALLLSGETGPRLAARGTADATARVRELAPHPWLTRPPPTLDADPARAAELLTLAQEHRTALTEDVIRLLHDALRPTTSSQAASRPASSGPPAPGAHTRPRPPSGRAPHRRAAAHSLPGTR
ncbi:hypothetical protein ACIHEI_35040 [Kitasatospora sp. NPDC051984]|uniref:hypothetical protein n=1 Tax=Kitasatospora sp. NPDC051984 TaxID=3364059 RepID=UPI0037CBCB29